MVIALNIKHYQIPLTTRQMERLKLVTGESTNQDALRVAVEFTIKNYKGKSK
jgi:hypothetical protein